MSTIKESIRECLYNLNKKIYRDEYHKIKMFGEDSYSDKCCMFSLLDLVCKAQEITVPFITNHKLFYEDPNYARPEQYSLNICDVAHFLILALVEGQGYIKENYSNIYTYNEFVSKINADKPVSSIHTENIIANYLLDLYRFKKAKSNTGYFYYSLFGLMVLHFLIKRGKNIDFSFTLDEEYSDYLCSLTLCLPKERRVTLYYFVYAYLMNDKQRNTNNCAYERALKMRGDIYSFNGLVDVLYQGGKEINSDLKKHINNFFVDAYKVVNLDFSQKNEKIDYQDIILMIIWKMLYRDKKKEGNNDDTEHSDDYLKFYKIIADSFDFRLLYNEESLENVEDNYTLFEPYRRNRYNVFNTLINTVPPEIDELYDYVGGFYKTIDFLNNIVDPPNFHLIKFDFYREELDYNLGQYIENEIHTPKQIVEEYKYKILYYNFLVGLSTQIQVYRDIENAYGILKPLKDHEAINNTELFEYKDINKDFIQKHKMWRIISDNPDEDEKDKVKMGKLTKKLTDSLKTFEKAMKMLTCGQEYTYRQYCAILWLIVHGEEIKITFPKSYQRKNSKSIPKNLSTIFKNMTEPDNTNKWYSVLIITLFAEEVRKIFTDPSGAPFYKRYLEFYEITYCIVKKRCDNLPPSQAIKAISYAFHCFEENIKILPNKNGN